MKISSPYIAEHEDYQVLSPHAVRVFPVWILLYWKHQETTRDNRKEQIMKHVFNKCSKNSPTSSGGEKNCTSETTSVMS